MNVLVTGTTTGIGQAIAIKFLSQGYRVIGFDVLPPSISNPRYTHYIKDIRDKDLPDLDVGILINNAGIQREGDEIEIDVNLKGTINITEKYGVQPNIKSIVFIASTSATSGAEFPNYAASKGGILAYMRNTAMRVAKYGATCNSLSPGGVITPINDHIMANKELYRACIEESLLGKWASSQEIAEFVYFTAITNKSMTGQDITIDNGENIKRNFIW